MRQFESPVNGHGLCCELRSTTEIKRVLGPRVQYGLDVSFSMKPI